MNALTNIAGQRESASSGWQAIPEAELLGTLHDSLYPGATDASIRMVLAYCRARRLDPLQKPVHIVPMNVKKPGTRDQYEWRDIVMPGINLYRIQADRTGEHVGTSEPVFGPMVKVHLGDRDYTVPEWCKVTVYRWKHGEARAFEAIEYWIENYATAGKDTDAPNVMWKKRTRGQLAKCAEAQALRKGFPEVGDQPTAEEMEGKTIDDGQTIEVETPPATVPQPKARSRQATITHNPRETFEVPQPRARAPVPARQPRQRRTQDAPTTPVTREPGTDDEPSEDNAPPSEPITDGMMRVLKQKMEQAALGEADLRKRFGVGYDGVTRASINAVLSWTENPTGA